MLAAPTVTLPKDRLDGVTVTAVAELTHVYLERGWGFYLVERECRPEFLPRMRALASGLRAPTYPRV